MKKKRKKEKELSVGYSSQPANLIGPDEWRT